jgi:sporulation protein YabP
MERHNVTIENRNRISITEVCSIDTFDEEEVCAELTEGGIIIKGKQLHIHMLDLEQGTAEITGRINSLTYTDKKKAKGTICRLFK